MVATGLFGCSSASVQNVSQDPEAALELWIRQTPNSPPAKTAQRLAAAFTRQVGIKTKVVALLEDFETKLQQQAAQRQLPDLVINDTAQLGHMQAQGWVQRVDRAALTVGDRISERSWQAAQAYDGDYYAVPFSAQAFALFVRRDWRLRLHLAEPRSWDDLATMAMAFTKLDPDGDGKNDTHGLVIPGTTKRGYLSWYFTTYLLANGGDFLRADYPGSWSPVISDPEAVGAALWLRDMVCQRKAANPDAVNIDTTRAHDTFEKGLGGIYLTGPYMLPRFVKSMGSEKIEIFQLPAGPNGSHPGALAEGENVYLMAGSRNRAGQVKFAEFAASVTGQMIGMDGDHPGPIVRLPVNQDVNLGAVRTDARWGIFQQVYETAGVYAPAVPNWTPFRQAAAETLNTLLADCTADVQQGLHRLAEDYRRELTRQQSLMS